MGHLQIGGKMEGWLHTIRSNRFGLQFSRKRYFVLEENYLKCYKAIPVSQKEEADRGAMIDYCVRVTDNGRESINRKVFFIFTLYSTLNHDDHLKLGAISSEEAASWIHSLQNAALKECASPMLKDFVAISKQKRPPIRLNVSKIDHKRNIDYYSTVHTDTITSDVIGPSPWKIFGCQNGLRLFKEANDWDSRGRKWDDHPAIMAVGLVNGTSEAIFQTVMSHGSSRSEWDFCYYRASIVEHLDGHTDIIHSLLYSDWLPWGMKRRDLLMRRYWRREDDGTYVILYHSVIHKKCPPKKGYIRAWVKSNNMHPPRLSPTAGLVKKLHDFAVQKKGYVDLQAEGDKENDTFCSYGATLQKDTSCTSPCSWTIADPTTFLIRGENYLKDHQKRKAKGTLMQMVGADWLRSDKREDNLGSRPDSIVQKYAVQDRPEFFFVVNIQVPGSIIHTLALYYMLKTPLEDTPLLHSFVNGDDAFRNSRFKLIPYISKGSWIVKQSVGKKACLVGQALKVNYFRGKNYLELGIDVGSSTVARGVVSLVLGYLNNLVIEMAFLV